MPALRKSLIWAFCGLWGAPQNIIGATLAVGARLRGHGGRRFRLAYVSEWGMGAGLSLGFFVFVPKGARSPLVVHEYGHTVQSMLLGPLYLPLCVVPSLLWAGLPVSTRIRSRLRVSYYDHPIEHWADVLGSRVCHEPSEGMLAVKARA